MFIFSEPKYLTKEARISMGISVDCVLNNHRVGPKGLHRLYPSAPESGGFSPRRTQSADWGTPSPSLELQLGFGEPSMFRRADMSRSPEFTLGRASRSRLQKGPRSVSHFPGAGPKPPDALTAGTPVLSSCLTKPQWKLEPGAFWVSRQ